ncbi:putative SAWADEE domain-containing protein [Dioscorea sansibarensis]
MAARSEELFDLEVKRKEDDSWFPCRISLSPNVGTLGILVGFKDYSQEDSIFNKEDALTCLRFRSSPLRGVECLQVKEGECVLAMHKAHCRSLFFDAIILKTFRVKHSARIHCRCCFEIKWLNSELKGTTTTVPSNSVMKLSEKDIASHPVVIEFSNSSGPTIDFKVPSLLSCQQETKYDVGICGLLEKQIEEISRLADESIQSSEDTILGVKGVSLGSPTNKYSSSTKNQRMLRRRMRSQNNQQVVTEVEKHSQHKPCLTPLAARAALASFVQALQQIPEFSICQIEQDVNTNPCPEDPKRQIDYSVQGTKLSSSYAITRRLTRSLVSKETQDSIDKSQKGSTNDNIGKTLNTRRLTRSQLWIENSNSNSFPEQEQSNLIENTDDACVEDLVTPENIERKKRRRTAFPGELSSGVNITQSGNSSNKQKPKLPSLSFRPRTRSQNKKLQAF